MAIFEGAARRVKSHWAHCGVSGRLLGITKRRARLLALHPNGSRRRDEKAMNRLLVALMTGQLGPSATEKQIIRAYPSAP